MNFIASILIALSLAVGAMAQPSFPTDVTVTLVKNGTVTLAWDRAASHTNLASFGLLIGVASGVYNVRQEQPQATTTCTVKDLAPGTYFFAVVARNLAGLDSDPSNEISYTVTRPAPPERNRITVNTRLEESQFPDGPWSHLADLGGVEVALSSPQRFFRAVLSPTITQ